MSIKPLLLTIPDLIVTERLILRAPQAGDGPMMSEAIHESLAELKPWMPWAQTAPSPEEAEIVTRENCVRWLERTEFQFRGFYHQRLALIISLLRINWDVPRFEIGYWTRTSSTGQGLMTEAVLGITEMAFDTLGARRVEIRMDAGNLRSRQVAERAGFALESTLKNNERGTDGTLRDTHIFALIREDGS